MTLSEHYRKALKEVEDMIDNAGYYDDVEALEKERQELLKKLQTYKEYSLFTITIRETLEKKVSVKARTLQEAKDMVRLNYKNQEDGYVLGADNYKDVVFFSEDDDKVEGV